MGPWLGGEGAEAAPPAWAWTSCGEPLSSPEERWRCGIRPEGVPWFESGSAENDYTESERLENRAAASITSDAMASALPSGGTCRRGRGRGLRWGARFPSANTGAPPN